MRCPKCHYLSFEPEPRCRNCGFDLAFEPGDLAFGRGDDSDDVAEDLDLRIAPPTPASLAAEMSLASAEIHAETPARNGRADTPAARIRVPSTPTPASPSKATPARTAELPLFVRGLPESDADEPLVKLPRAPRAPLSVRRPTPTPGRLREKYQRESASPRLADPPEPTLLSEEEDEARRGPASAMRGFGPGPEAADPPQGDETAGAVRRIEAAVLDALLIGAINVAVIWLTLQKCDLTLDQAALLPILPIAAVLFLLDGGYLLLFTATIGQTIGKMAAGIRVVGASDEAIVSERVTLKQALLRAALTFPSVLAFGAGFVPALTASGLAFHDRFAHTRVVRA